jgi:hypothetical protein
VIQRVEQYEPRREFVVVFQACGLAGAGEGGVHGLDHINVLEG